MSAIDELFATLRRSDRKALIPYFTAGDPDIGTTEALLRAAGPAGADLCEVGIPYSDPIADGPVIQAAYQRALDNGFRLGQAFELGGRVAADVATPLVTMVSYAIIHRVGMAEYVAKARAAGYAGAIVPDLPVEEAEELAKVCGDADFSVIQLVTPTTSPERQRRIAQSSSGFLYYVSVTGITGERSAIPENLVANVRRLRGETDLPICIGFGISSVEVARELAPVADGLIVGSAIVRRVAEAKDRGSAVATAETFIGELRRAIDETSDSRV